MARSRHSRHNPPGILGIESHPTARDQAIALGSIVAGQCVLSSTSLATSLLPHEKGRRCDHCHIAVSTEQKLSRCSGCAAFWYCGVQCQTTQWKAHHRKLCKEFNGYSASPIFQSLSETERVDAVLLSQLIVAISPNNTFKFDSVSSEDPWDDLASTFLDLMQRVPEGSVPPVCTPRGSPPPPSKVVLDLFSRFGSNNFVIHSHLTAFAHGIFPVASRLLNHSCIPNCVPKYIITPGQPIGMEVIALRSIKIGEEITIPYLDVALPYDTRSIALQANYGFCCQCSLCKSCDRIYPVPTPPKEGTDLQRLESVLISLVLEQASDGSVLLKEGDFDISMLPPELYPLLDQSYLPRISEAFSKASHEGQYDVALMAGLVMLAMYIVIYPSNFPLIGMHALELAKTSWNATVSDDSLVLNHLIRASTPKHLERLAKSYLELAQGILETYGLEGDQGGPMEDIELLRELLVM